jgi:hypothetical protein
MLEAPIGLQPEVEGLDPTGAVVAYQAFSSKRRIGDGRSAVRQIRGPDENVPLLRKEPLLL